MQSVSKEYKELLKKPFIDSTYQTNIELGAINQETQASAYITIGSQMTNYSTGDIFDDVISDPYSSYELNHTKADGLLKFLGKPLSAGIVSSQISDAAGVIDHTIKIQSTVAIPLQIKGITITFTNDVHAIDFEILNSKGDILLRVHDNNQAIYINDFVYEFDQSLSIHITKVSKPYYRCRVSCIKFGLALRFTSDQIMSTSYQEQIQLIGTELYTSDLSVTINNQDGVYNVDNPSSEINFLQEAQKMQVSVSLPLPSGRTDIILLGTFYLQQWSATSEIAKFKAVDRLYFMTGDYKRGIYRPYGITLYDLAIDVLHDAGVSNDEYLIDVYLKTIKVYNPMPVITHREALQLIANAGRCILKQDRDGRILIRSSFVPDMVALSDDKTVYSNMDLSTDKKNTYATYEQDFTRADGKTFLLPSDGKYLSTGYVSDTLSNGDCLYGNKPHILINFEAPANLFGFNIIFGATTASDFILSTYLDETSIETLAFSGNTLKEFCLNYPFKECNRILVTFTRSNMPSQRVYVDSVTFDTTTDKHITQSDVSRGTLAGIKTETIKQLDMIMTVYTPGVLETSDVKITKIPGSDKSTLIEFNDPVSEADIQMAGKSVGYDMTAWGCKVDLSPPATGVKEYVLQVSNRKLNKVTQSISFVINTTGETKTCENPLVSDAQLAMDTGQWVADYLKADREYDFDYNHGDASLDTNDIIHQYNQYDSDLCTQVYRHSLSIVGAITGKIKARKVMK